MRLKCAWIWWAGLQLLLGWQPVFAQVNIEAMRKSELGEGWRGSLSGDFALNDGNSDFLKLKGGARIDYVHRKWHTFLIGNYQRGLQANRVFINKGFVHLRFVHKLSQKHAVEVFGQKEFNDFIDLQDRDLLGGGVRLGFFQTDSLGKSSGKLRLFLGIGGMWEREELDETTGIRETKLFRSTNYLSARWHLDDRVSLNLISYYQVALERTSDYRILADGGMEFRITRAVVFRTSLNFRFDNEPSPGVEKHDLELVNGVGISL